MLKIDKEVRGDVTTIRLFGRLRAEHLDDVRRELERSGPTELDLDEVTLLDIEVVRFLAGVERAGVVLSHCAPFIREWMRREGGRLA